MVGGGAFEAVEEVDGVLRVGEDPHRPGAADVEVLGVAEGGELGGDDGDGSVEGHRVGGVQGHVHVGGGGVAAVLDPDPAAGEFVFLVGDGAVGVEVEPGLLDESFGVDEPDLVRDCGDEPVGVGDRLAREVVGLPGDRPGPPHRHPARDHEVPQAGEAVGQLQGVGDQLPARVEDDVERGGQLGRGELGDQRRAFAGERGDGLVEQVGLAPVGGPLVLRAGVQQRPLHGELDLSDGGLVRGSRTARTRSIT